MLWKGLAKSRTKLVALPRDVVPRHLFGMALVSHSLAVYCDRQTLVFPRSRHLIKYGGVPKIDNLTPNEERRRPLAGEEHATPVNSSVCLHRTRASPHQRVCAAISLISTDSRSGALSRVLVTKGQCRPGPFDLDGANSAGMTKDDVPFQTRSVASAALLF